MGERTGKRILRASHHPERKGCSHLLPDKLLSPPNPLDSHLRGAQAQKGCRQTDRLIAVRMQEETQAVRDGQRAPDSRLIHVKSGRGKSRKFWLQISCRGGKRTRRGVIVLMKHKILSCQYPQHRKRENCHAPFPWGKH